MALDFLVGTYISSSTNTVYSCHVNKDKNVKIKANIAAEKNPSFLCLNRAKDTLYAVNELAKDIHGEYGKVVMLQKKLLGTFTLRSSQSTQGDYPCHLALSNDEDILFVTNYGSGSVCAYEISSKTLKLVQELEFSGKSVHKERQTQSHAHHILLSPYGKYMFITDLGCDCIYTFEIAKKEDMVSEEYPLKLISKTKTPSGSGPRHMVWDGDKKNIYVSAELSGSVLVYQYEETEAKLTFKQECRGICSAYPKNSPSEIASHQDHIYMAHRGDDVIEVFKQAVDGTLECLHSYSCGGKTPRHFKIFPQTPWGGEATLVVANQDSDNIVFFSIEKSKIVKQHEAHIVKPSVIC